MQQIVVVTQDLLFGLPFYKYFRTKSWNALTESMMAVYKISMRHIEAKISEIKDMDKETREERLSEENTDFLTHMILNGKMSLEEISTNAMDLLGAGVDTVSRANNKGTLSISFRYYHEPF